MKPKIESPRTFNSIHDGIEWHNEHRCFGWFIVNECVFWTYGDESWKLTAITVKEAADLDNLFMEEGLSMKRKTPMLNRKNVKAYLKEEAHRAAKHRLQRVSASTYEWLERELIKKMRHVISMQAYSGPKTITPPSV